MIDISKRLALLFCLLSSNTLVAQELPAPSLDTLLKTYLLPYAGDPEPLRAFAPALFPKPADWQRSMQGVFNFDTDKFLLLRARDREQFVTEESLGTYPWRGGASAILIAPHLLLTASHNVNLETRYDESVMPPAIPSLTRLMLMLNRRDKVYKRQQHIADVESFVLLDDPCLDFSLLFLPKNWQQSSELQPVTLNFAAPSLSAAQKLYYAVGYPVLPQDIYELLRDDDVSRRRSIVLARQIPTASIQSCDDVRCQSTSQHSLQDFFFTMDRKFPYGLSGGGLFDATGSLVGVNIQTHEIDDDDPQGRKLVAPHALATTIYGINQIYRLQELIATIESAVSAADFDTAQLTEIIKKHSAKGSLQDPQKIVGFPEKWRQYYAHAK
jgi:hypothetical protein